MLLVLVVLLVISVGLVLIFTIYIFYEINKLPDITPAKYLSEEEKSGFTVRKTVVVIGDSITHGRISQDYVKILRERLGEEYKFVNAGINSHLAWNVLERLKEIIECKPAIITILIGTNDVNATLSLKNKKDYIKRMKLPQDPTHEWYTKTLKEIIQRLKTKTNAQIAVLTLPTIGEDLESPFFDKTKQYSKSITDIATEMGVSSLPLHDTMMSSLESDPGKPTFSYEKGQMHTLSSVFQHYFLRRSWDFIATNAGFKLHWDYLHMNTKGATMIAELIENYIYSLN